MMSRKFLGPNRKYVSEWFSQTWDSTLYLTSLFWRNCYDTR